MASLVLALAVIAAACGRGDGDGTAPTTTAPSSDATTTTLDPEAEVVAAYRAHFDALLEAADPPDPDHPALEATTTGRALELMRSVLEGDRVGGVVRRGSFDLQPVDVELIDGRAVVVSCRHDRTTVYDAATGEAVSEPDREPGLHRVELVREGGRWKVEVVIEEEGEC